MLVNSLIILYANHAHNIASHWIFAAKPSDGTDECLITYTIVSGQMDAVFVGEEVILAKKSSVSSELVLLLLV